MPLYVIRVSSPSVGGGVVKSYERRAPSAQAAADEAESRYGVGGPVTAVNKHNADDRAVATGSSRKTASARG